METNSAATFESLTLTKEESNNGSISFRNGKAELHREHGPAVSWKDGTQLWFRCGLLHRENGPAVVYPSNANACYYYLYGKEYPKDEYWKKVNLYGL